MSFLKKIETLAKLPISDKERADREKQRAKEILRSGGMGIRKEPPERTERKPSASEEARKRWGSGGQLPDPPAMRQAEKQWDEMAKKSQFGPKGQDVRNRLEQIQKSGHEQQTSPKYHQHADWVDPLAYQSLHNRYSDHDITHREIDEQGKSGDEPYKGIDYHNLAWRTSDKEEHERLPYPIPVKVGDLRGTLGKDVPQGGHDPFIWADSKFRVSHKLLQKNKDKALTIQTRSDLIAHDDYLKELNPKLHKVKMHFLTTDPKVQRVLEPGAPSAGRRATAVKKLAEAGIPVTIVIDELTNPKMPPELKQLLTDKEHMHKELGGALQSGIKFETNKVKLTDKALENILRALGMKKAIASTQEIYAALQDKYPKEETKLLEKVTADIYYSGESEEVLADSTVVDRLFERWKKHGVKEEAHAAQQRMNADTADVCPICKMATTAVMLDKDTPAKWCQKHYVIFPIKQESSKTGEEKK